MRTSSDRPTTAAPDPSARITHVVRSAKSIHPEKRSEATTRTLRAWPHRTKAEAAFSEYVKPEHPELTS
jgi:hypothetical protein